jgi:UPF0176 protein
MYQVLLFYKYVDVEDPQGLAERIRTLSTELSLTGRVIVAEEGINGTLEGTLENTEDFVKQFFRDERFSDVQVKRSAGEGNSFPRLKVKVRKEIVGTGFTEEEANPRVKTAPKISPEELRSWYEKGEDFVVVDMRNDYEFASGRFKNAVEPGITASRYLPLALAKLAPLKDKKILTVCTGGIRCEKMAPYLMHNGFTDVHQLDGGIHSYMEKYPGEDFEGTLFTFDGRKTMHFGGNRKIVGTCHLCSAPSESYADCAQPSCHKLFIACAACRNEDGDVYCSEACRVTHGAVRV